MRPPVDAQATWVAGSKGWAPELPLACDGLQMVSPSFREINALPLLLREIMPSTVARKPQPPELDSSSVAAAGPAK